MSRPLGGGVGFSLESEVGCEALVHEIEAAFGGCAEADAPALSEAEVEPWSLASPSEFRAALPGAMVRVLRGDEGRGLRWWLTLPLSGDEEVHLSKWTLLDARQRVCVGRFLRCMGEAARAKGSQDAASLWEEAYESHWEA